MGAVEDWKEDLGALLDYTVPGDPVPAEQLQAVIQKSQLWIGSLDNLVDSLTKQVTTLRLAESQWIPTRPQEARSRFGCIGEESRAE